MHGALKAQFAASKLKGSMMRLSAVTEKYYLLIAITTLQCLDHYNATHPRTVDSFGLSVGN